MRLFSSKWFLVLPWLLVLGYGAVSMAQDYRQFQELKGSEQALLHGIQSDLLLVADQFQREMKLVDEQFRAEEEYPSISRGVEKFAEASRALRASIRKLVSIRFFPRSASKLREASELLEKEEELLAALASTKLELLKTQNAILRLPATVEYHRTRKEYYAGRLDLWNWLAAQKALAQSETALNYMEDQVEMLESSVDYLKQQGRQMRALLDSTVNELQYTLQVEHSTGYRDYLTARFHTFDLSDSLHRFFESRP